MIGEQELRRGRYFGRGGDRCLLNFQTRRKYLRNLKASIDVQDVIIELMNENSRNWHFAIGAFCVLAGNNIGSK